jgi:hypothetical protein
MKGKLFTPRRDVFFFGTPAGDDRFSYPNFPTIPRTTRSATTASPASTTAGSRCARSGEKTAFDPDTDERLVSAYQVKRARDYLAVRFPALRDQPVVETRGLPARDERGRALHRRPASRAENVWLVGGGLVTATSTGR